VKPTQLRLKPEYRKKLEELAKRENRSMANMNEVLIDEAYARIKTKGESGR
jgi:predicted DNA-binding protein